jgi:ribosomal protein L29
MARGWESKSVEAQMEESVAEPTTKRTVLTPEELQKQRRKMDLELSRSRVLQQLEQNTNERYSELLRRTLAELDQQIGRL